MALRYFATLCAVLWASNAVMSTQAATETESLILEQLQRQNQMLEGLSQQCATANKPTFRTPAAAVKSVSEKRQPVGRHQWNRHSQAWECRDRSSDPTACEKALGEATTWDVNGVDSGCKAYPTAAMLDEKTGAFRFQDCSKIVADGGDLDSSIECPASPTEPTVWPFTAVKGEQTDDGQWHLKNGCGACPADSFPVKHHPNHHSGLDYLQCSTRESILADGLKTVCKPDWVTELDGVANASISTKSPVSCTTAGPVEVEITAVADLDSLRFFHTVKCLMVKRSMCAEVESLHEALGSPSTPQVQTNARRCASFKELTFESLTLHKAKNDPGTMIFDQKSYVVASSDNGSPSSSSAPTLSEIEAVFTADLQRTEEGMDERCEQVSDRCYTRQPNGCPSRQYDAHEWSRDPHGNSGSSQAACEGRKSGHDHWCGNTDSEWVFGFMQWTATSLADCETAVRQAYHPHQAYLSYTDSGDYNCRGYETCVSRENAANWTSYKIPPLSNTTTQKYLDDIWPQLIRYDDKYGICNTLAQAL